MRGKLVIQGKNKIYGKKQVLVENQYYQHGCSFDDTGIYSHVYIHLYFNVLLFYFFCVCVYSMAISFGSGFNGFPF